ncbi:MAG: glyoxylase-like metal-dependent hydrolase (beta-lactamase superfamily II) [Halocynthiibacter sp.]|jgi:glyoxylase-like metal-dependent hydrolase (beta-lactamase superfamily II)
MAITRRLLLQRSAAALAGTMVPMQIWANTTLTIGPIQIDTLSDGNLMLPRNFQFGELAPSDIDPILEKYGITGDQIMPDCNVTLLRDGTNTVLFDAGSGTEFMPSAGKLPDALDAIGLAPEDVTHVVFTHAHPDHLWGVLDDFNDPYFPNASYLIGQTEFDFWLNPNTVDEISAGRVAFAVGAKRRLEAISDQLAFFTDGEEILPGIAARASFGHTPGHMSFEVNHGNNSVMIVGDSIANHHVAFERPDLFSGSDQDQTLAAQTRIKLLDQLAHNQMHLIGFHLPYPGIGRAEKRDGGFIFVAE